MRFIFVIVAVVLGGCGNRIDSASQDPSTPVSPATWVPTEVPSSGSHDVGLGRMVAPPSTDASAGVSEDAKRETEKRLEMVSEELRDSPADLHMLAAARTILHSFPVQVDKLVEAMKTSSSSSVNRAQVMTDFYYLRWEVRDRVYNYPGSTREDLELVDYIFGEVESKVNEMDLNELARFHKIVITALSDSEFLGFLTRLLERMAEEITYRYV